jgi:hypothetical protein
VVQELWRHSSPRSFSPWPVSRTFTPHPLDTPAQEAIWRWPCTTRSPRPMPSSPPSSGPPPCSTTHHSRSTLTSWPRKPSSKHTYSYHIILQNSLFSECVRRASRASATVRCADLKHFVWKIPVIVLTKDCGIQNTLFF